jgi:murein DD-endopeptidase MepM/ murein hydrolase activator NlpD
MNALRRPALVWALLGCSGLLNVALLVDRSRSPDAETKVQAAPKPVATGPVDADAVEEVVAKGPSKAWVALNADVQNSLSHTVANAVLDPKDGAALAQTIARFLVWHMRPDRDLANGDKLDVLYRVEEPAGRKQVDIAALRYVSAKLNKTLKAFVFQAPGEKFASWYDESGAEFIPQLAAPVLREYQMISSVLGDGRRHDGMDFQVPTGTEVLAPLAGKVVRSNWNHNANGNCIEIAFEDGVLAKFLHLSENRVKPGDVVTAGQVIALSGNTGHSSGPHLHYQLNQGAKVLDPREYHGLAAKRQLSGEALAKFEAQRKTLEAAMAPRTAEK